MRVGVYNRVSTLRCSHGAATSPIHASSRLLMVASRTLLLVAALLCGTVHAAMKMPKEHHDEMHRKMKEHHEEMKHLNKIKNHEVDDWTVHIDVDDSVYWFSRMLKRSVKEPPEGWKKSEKTGKWIPPPRKPRDEL